MNVEIKQATLKDASLILDMIIELADYEKARHEVKASVADIEDSLFNQDSRTEALICYIDGKAAGYAVFFTSYSTWLGNNGIYLEDLYVSPDFRGAGAGKKLLKHIAVLAAERKCQRYHLLPSLLITEKRLHRFMLRMNLGRHSLGQS